MLKRIVRNLANLPGWQTNRKIVVIESDDWGSIRMPSLDTFIKLHKKGLDVTCYEGLHYNLNDTLASANDLALLYETLLKFKDKNGNNPVFTAVSLVANPNFVKIKESGYNQYYYEPFTETLENYDKKDAFPLWMEGIKNKLFIPQFHGREHLNIGLWMRALRKNDEHAIIGFEHEIWGFNNVHPFGLTYQAAFDLEVVSDLKIQEESIISGLKLFEDIFGYKAEFFVPPNGPINNSLEKVAFDCGIKYMSTSKIQNEVLGEGKTCRHLHYLGQKNQYGQRYLTRNCFFEPSQPDKDWINSCLKEIENAFMWKKPAVISTHRVNYIGSLNESNRVRGLKSLEDLLSKIIKKWPEIEFMTSTQLGDLISK